MSLSRRYARSIGRASFIDKLPHRLFSNSRTPFWETDYDRHKTAERLKREVSVRASQVVKQAVVKTSSPASDILFAVRPSEGIFDMMID